MRVKVYGSSTCPHCIGARNHLKSSGIEFSDIVMDSYEDRQAFYDSLGLIEGQRTVPQIFVDDERIGGFSDLKARFDYVKERLAKSV